jgi:hypothetical protein
MNWPGLVVGIKNKVVIEINVFAGHSAKHLRRNRYLAWLKSKFHGESRLVAALYYPGERVIAARGLVRDGVLYVDQHP